MSSSHSLVPHGNAAARAAAQRPLHVAARARHSAPLARYRSDCAPARQMMPTIRCTRRPERPPAPVLAILMRLVSRSRLGVVSVVKCTR